MSAPAPDPPPASADEPKRRPATAAPRDFADLARRISGRTTDLFAIVLVLVVLLTVGSRLTEWWRAEPPAVATSPADAPLAIWDGPANLAVEFDAGPWQLTRTVGSGSAEDIIRSAIEAAARTLRAEPSVELPPSDAAEEQWLQQLRDWPPQVETERGAIYVLGGPWPWIVATRSGFEGNEESGDALHATDARRVICWTFALPRAPQQWTVYSAVRAHGTGTNTSGTGVVVPVDAQRLLTARSSEGGITTFRSEGSLLSVQDFWNRQLLAGGWQPVNDWSGDDDARRATFRKQESGGALQLEAALLRTTDNATTGIADWHRQ